MSAMADSICAESEVMTEYGDMTIAVTDPLHASISLPFRHVLFPFGFATDIKSNDATVIRAAEQSWARFRQRFRESPIEMRFIISDCISGHVPSYPTFRAQGNLLMIVADAHNFACCDLAGGFGFACLTKAAVVNGEYVRYNFLEAMAYTLLDAKHVAAVHAACLVRSGHGVLFVGDSGAGKSSIAYACANRGWTYISDDATSVLRRRTGRMVVGNPQTFRFRPSARVLFPELQGQTTVRNGKPTIEIETEGLPGIKTAEECIVDYVVFLNRNGKTDGPPRLGIVRPEESFRRLFKQNVWPSELSINEERLDSVQRLLGAELLELTYRELDPAIDLLEGVLDRGQS